MTTTTEPTYTKGIIWNPVTKDYDLFLGLEFVGSAVNYVDGENVLDQIIADRKPQPPTPAAQMSALLNQYTTAKAENRLDDAKQIKLLAVALEVEHPGTTDLVKAERSKAA